MIHTIALCESEMRLQQSRHGHEIEGLSSIVLTHRCKQLEQCRECTAPCLLHLHQHLLRVAAVLPQVSRLQLIRVGESIRPVQQQQRANSGHIARQRRKAAAPYLAHSLPLPGAVAVEPVWDRRLWLQSATAKIRSEQSQDITAKQTSMHHSSHPIFLVDQTRLSVPQCQLDPALVIIRGLNANVFDPSSLQKPTGT